ncbi:MAG: hypothetical protein ABW006_14155 [Hyphomicrobium sp.]
MASSGTGDAAARRTNFEVSGFPMEVRGQEKWWPEKGERNAIWVSPDVAFGLVHKGQLKKLISQFAAQFEKAGMSDCLL